MTRSYVMCAACVCVWLCNVCCVCVCVVVYCVLRVCVVVYCALRVCVCVLLWNLKDMCSSLLHMFIVRVTCLIRTCDVPHSHM